MPFLRAGNRPPLRSGRGEVPIPAEVWAFFRDVKAVEALGERIGRPILVLHEMFAPREREKYRQQVVTRLRALLQQPKVVLLDPDTGIEPGKSAAEHVTVEDIRAVWEVLNPRDWLVLYQHASRRRTWQKDACAKFFEACGVPDPELFASAVAPDVVFIATPKSQTGRCPGSNGV